MKRLLFIIASILLMSITASAQEVQIRLDEALSSYRSEDLENARFSLQEALIGINEAVGQEILSVFPAEMNGMNKVDENDEVTGMNVGFAGLLVHRSYIGEEGEASIDLISDSPMLAGINTILAMPGFMTSDPNQKRVKVSNYKALLTRNEDDTGKVSYDLQVPLNSSLLAFQCSGIEDENEVLDLAELIPVKRIVEILE